MSAFIKITADLRNSSTHEIRKEFLKEVKNMARTEMEEIMHEESLREMERMGKRAESISGSVDMHELMAEESARDMKTMYARAAQVTKY